MKEKAMGAEKRLNIIAAFNLHFRQQDRRSVWVKATSAASGGSDHLALGARDVRLHFGGVCKLEGVLEHVSAAF